MSYDCLNITAFWKSKPFREQKWVRKPSTTRLEQAKKELFLTFQKYKHNTYNQASDEQICLQELKTDKVA